MVKKEFENFEFLLMNVTLLLILVTLDGAE